MNRSELEHFTDNNKLSSISNTRYITGIALTAIIRGSHSIFFYNGLIIHETKYNELMSLYGLDTDNVTTIIEYRLIEFIVTLHYYKGTLEKIVKEYCNDNGVNVTDVTTNFEVRS